MLPMTDSETMQTITLDRALAYAVIHSWEELMPDRTSGLIHIEYQTGSGGSIDFLKAWASTTRGSWKLVCELWMRPLWSHIAGLRFENDYHSEAFGNNLELVLGQEGTFPRLPKKEGLIQIYPPTQEEQIEADRWLTVAFNHGNSVLVKSNAAAVNDSLTKSITSIPKRIVRDTKYRNQEREYHGI